MAIACRPCCTDALAPFESFRVMPHLLTAAPTANPPFSLRFAGTSYGTMDNPAAGQAPQWHRAEWTEEEDDRFTALVQQQWNAAGNQASMRFDWRAISQALGGRHTHEQCREHYQRTNTPVVSGIREERAALGGERAARGEGAPPPRR